MDLRYLCPLQLISILFPSLSFPLTPTRSCSRLVNHCRALRQLYIFGSGASEKASNTKIRTRVKTKTARLAKLTAGRPKLTLISTKMQLKNVQAKREEVGGRGGGFVEEADGGLQGLQQYY